MSPNCNQFLQPNVPLKLNLCGVRWNLYWQRRFHADTHLENCVKLLFCSPTTSRHSEVRQPACTAVTGYVTDTDATRLRQRNPVWCSWPPAGLVPVCSQYSWAPCLSCVEVRPHHSSAPWLALVAGPGENTQRNWPLLSSAVVTTWRLRTSPVTCTGPTRQKRYNVDVHALASDWSCRERDFTRLATVHSVWRRHEDGTVFPPVSLQHLHWRLCQTIEIWEHSCLITLFVNIYFNYVSRVL